MKRQQPPNGHHSPPDWIDKFLEWYCSEYYLEEIQGDLHEWFQRRVETQGPRKARRMYLLDVLRYLRVFRTKPFHQLTNSPNYLSMKNVFKITYRNLLKDKISGFIRISNLVIGITVFLLALIYARYELNYDQFHPNKDNLYRVGMMNQGNPWAAMPLGLGMFAEENVPGVERMTRLLPIYDTWLKYEDNKFYEKRGYEADSSIFQMFGIEFIAGNPRTALERPDAIVLTESIAKKYFGDKDPTGKMVQLLADRGHSRQVTAVIKDLPDQSHLQFDFLCSMYYMSSESLHRWRNFFAYTYLELAPGADVENAKKLIIEEARTRYKVDESVLGETILTPITKIHLYTNYEKEFADNGNVYYVYILFCIGVFVLLISSINFINLTVIKGLDRAKEVGLRKTIGASRQQLIVQFLSENMFYLLFSGVVSLILLTGLAPYFRDFSGLNLPLSFWNNPGVLLSLTGIIVTLELISGIYPAFVLSKFQPAEVIKPGMSSGSPMRRVGLVRQSLIVAQFSLSVILIIGSMVVYDQLTYIQSQDLGFEKDQVLLSELNSDILAKRDVFRDKLLEIPGIKSMSISTSVPGYRIMMETVKKLDGSEETDTRLMYADQYMPQTYDLQFVAGKDFSDQVPERETEYILNEQLATQLFSDGQNPIGVKIKHGRDTGRVVGIVKDFNFKSLHSGLEPLLIKRLKRAYWGYLSIRFESKNTNDVLIAVEEASREVYPDLPVIETQFLNDRFAQLYQAEFKLQNIAWVFCLLTILLTISGIFGVATYNAHKRSKEIAIRKVLGGGLFEMLKQLNRGFVVLFVAALVLAIPGAYYLANWWLQDFAYQVGLNPLIFLISSVSLLVIVMISSGYVTVKAANANPAEVLKSE